MARVIKSPITQDAWFAFWFAGFLTFSAWLFFTWVAKLPQSIGAGGLLVLFLAGFVASLIYLRCFPARLNIASEACQHQNLDEFQSLGSCCAR